MSIKSIEFAKKNIRRTPFQAIAASMVMTLTFFALISFTILAVGSQAILKFYESKPQVIAFFKDGTTEQDINAISNALKQDAKVTNTKFISKEEALNIYRDRNKNDPALLELVTANILPASIEISTTTPQDLSYIADLLKKEPVVEDVVVPQDVVESLTSTTKIIRIVGATIVIFLTAFGSLIILLIIGFKIRVKRAEIEIMRLIGASPSFIRNPFIIEGISYGIVGAITSWILIYSLLWYFSPFLSEFLGVVKLFPINPIFMLAILGGSILIATIIGTLGSIAAVKRYLHI